MPANPVRNLGKTVTLWARAESVVGDDLQVWGRLFQIGSEQRLIRMLHENPAVGELDYGFLDMRVNALVSTAVWDPMVFSGSAEAPVDPEEPPPTPGTSRACATRDQVRDAAGLLPLDDGVVAYASDLTSLFGTPSPSTPTRAVWLTEVPPGIPTGLLCAPGNAQVGLTWTPPTSTGTPPVTGYTVQFSNDNGSTWTTFAEASDPADPVVTVTGLANGTGYVFRVAAVSAAGRGLFSPQSPAALPTAPGAAGPDTVPGLAHWFVADDLSALGAGGAVASWPDRVAGTAEQGAGAAQPTYQPGVVNGHGAARFFGGQRMATTPVGAALGPNWTVYAVCKWTGTTSSAGASAPVGADAGFNPNRVFQLRFAGSTLTASGFNTSGSINDTEPISSPTAWGVYSGSRDGTAVRAAVNGTADASTTGTGTPRVITRSMLIGSCRDDAGYFFYGDIAEVVFYNRALTDTERATVRAYLGARYGISVA